MTKEPLDNINDMLQSSVLPWAAGRLVGSGGPTFAKTKTGRPVMPARYIYVRATPTAAGHPFGKVENCISKTANHRPVIGDRSTLHSRMPLQGLHYACRNHPNCLWKSVNKCSQIVPKLIQNRCLRRSGGHFGATRVQRLPQDIIFNDFTCFWDPIWRPVLDIFVCQLLYLSDTFLFTK